MKEETIKNRLMKYKYFKEETLFIDNWNNDFISLQPTSQYTFYNYVNLEKIKNILIFLFKNTEIKNIRIGNWLYDKETILKELEE